MKKWWVVMVFSIIAVSGGKTWAKDMSIELPQLDNFPINNPKEAGKIQCYSGSNKDDTWEIFQVKNDVSLCEDPGNQPFDQECAGASIAREVGGTDKKGARFCYWKDQKKVKIGVDTSKWQNGGCCANCGPESVNNPGGYSVYLMSRINLMPHWEKPYIYTDNMSALWQETDFETNSYGTNSCPADSPIDPEAGRNVAGFSYFNLIFNMEDETNGQYKGTVFYQTILYDNRPEWQDGSAEYHNCGFPNPDGWRWVVATVPVNKFGMTMNRPGQPAKKYRWNVLPKVSEEIERCGIKGVRLRLVGYFIGNELLNGIAMTNTFTNTKLTITEKDSLPAGYAEKSGNECLISGWACDANDYKKALTVDIIDVSQGNKLISSTIANLTREAAVGSRCGGENNRGFSFTLPGGTGPKIEAKARDIDGEGMETGIKTKLTEYPTDLQFNCTSQPTTIPSISQKQGDANRDGRVDLTDLGIWKIEYVSKTGKTTDFNRDGTVDLTDLAIWKTEYLKPVCPPGGC